MNMASWPPGMINSEQAFNPETDFLLLRFLVFCCLLQEWGLTQTMNLLLLFFTFKWKLLSSRSFIISHDNGCMPIKNIWKHHN